MSKSKLFSEDTVKNQETETSENPKLQLENSINLLLNFVVTEIRYCIDEKGVKKDPEDMMLKINIAENLNE